MVFTLSGFSRNLRKEVGKTQKIYFYDVGVRNALLQAFSPLSLRNDVGARLFYKVRLLHMSPRHPTLDRILSANLRASLERESRDHEQRLLEMIRPRDLSFMEHTTLTTWKGPTRMVRFPLLLGIRLGIQISPLVFQEGVQ